MTGHELLAELQRHPEWLGYEVSMIVPEGADTGDGVALLGVDYDQFEVDGPHFLVLSGLE